MDFNFLDFDKKLLAEISNELNSVVHSRFWSGGPYIQKTEAKFDEIYNFKSVSCSSGGMALELIANAFPSINKIGIQSNTYFATALPWLNREKELFLIGTDNNSLTPSFEFVKKTIKKGVDAIVLTHIGGYPIPEIEKISAYCRSNGIYLIEDCAHSPLTKINNKYVGTFGDAAIFSFSQRNQSLQEREVWFFLEIQNLRKSKKIRDYGKEKKKELSYINYQLFQMGD